MINELAKQIHANAKSKGFFDNEKNIGEMLMLIVTEAAEACEADRIGNYYAGSVDAVIGDKGFPRANDEQYKKSFENCGIKNSFEDELADIMIRVMDLAAYKGVNL